MPIAENAYERPFRFTDRRGAGDPIRRADFDEAFDDMAAGLQVALERSDEIDLHFPARADFVDFAGVGSAPVGALASDPRSDYVRLASNGGLSPAPLWHPRDVVTPWHFGGDPTGGTGSADALAEADAYVAAREGRILVVDGLLSLERPVDLRSRHVAVRGLIRPTPGFNPGTLDYLLSTGANTGVSSGIFGEHQATYRLDGSAYCGRAVGTWTPSGGTFPATGLNGGAILAGDSFMPLDAGTVDGAAFDTTDRLVALVDNPSSTAFAGQWAKRKAIALLRVSGLDLPFANIRVSGRNADTVLAIKGTTEKIDVEASGWGCHDVVREDPDGGASPQHNAIKVRAAACGRAYASTGDVGSPVHLAVHGQIAGYGRPAVDVRSSRRQVLSGAIHTPHSEAVYVEQDVTSALASVHLHGLSVTDPANSGKPWLHVAKTRGITGQAYCRRPYQGLYVDQCDGMDLRAFVEGQMAGQYYRLGRTSTNQEASKGRFAFTAVAPQAAVTGPQIQKVDSLVVENLGTPRSVTVTAQSRSKLIMPASAFGAGATVSRGSGPAIEVEYAGTDVDAAAQAVSNAAAVALNALVGQVTTFGANLAAGARVTFRVNNSRMEAYDLVVIGVRTPTGIYVAQVTGQGDGWFDVTLLNYTGAVANVPALIVFRILKGMLA